jgi:hypothetical protein
MDLLNRLENVKASSKTLISDVVYTRIIEEFEELKEDRRQIKEKFELLYNSFEGIDKFHSLSWDEKRNNNMIGLGYIVDTVDKLKKLYMSMIEDFYSSLFDIVTGHYNIKFDSNVCERLTKLREKWCGGSKYDRKDIYGESHINIDDFINIIVEEIPDLESEGLNQAKKLFLKYCEGWRGGSRITLNKNKLTIKEFAWLDMTYSGQYEIHYNNESFKHLRNILCKFFGVSFTNLVNDLLYNRGKIDFTYIYRDNMTGVGVKFFKNRKVELYFKDNEEAINFCKFTGADKYLTK